MNRQIINSTSKSVYVIDIGSSSIRFLSARHGNGDRVHILRDRGFISGLGQGLQSGGLISEEAIETTIFGIRKILDYPEIKHGYGACIATQAMRSARNGPELAQSIEKIIDCPVEILSGQREGELAWIGSQDLLTPESVLVDMGGGSTEIVFRLKHGILKVNSFPWGAASFRTKIDMSAKVSARSIDKMMGEAQLWCRQILRKVNLPRKYKLVFLGGTATTLAAVKNSIHIYKPGCVHGSELNIDEMQRLLGRIRKYASKKRLSIPGMESGREEIIISGTVLALSLISALEQERIVVSEEGIRYGRISELLGLLN